MTTIGSTGSTSAAPEFAAALDAVAADPPTILAGDAIELLPRLSLPEDVPLVVFHAMVRVHVPSDRRAIFDSAIAALGRRRRLLHVSFELDGSGCLLALRDARGEDRDLARVEGHGRWIQPLY